MLLGRTFCWDGVFEVFWTDIFNILLQESIPIVWPDCGQQKNVLSVLCNIEKTIMITSSLNYRPVSLKSEDEEFCYQEHLFLIHQASFPDQSFKV